MKPIPVTEFAQRCEGTPLSFKPDALLSGFALDSREVRPGDLFLAFKGEKVDGHDYVGQAMEKGAVGALVQRAVEGPQILVADVIGALASFATSVRSDFHGPVVGITGSAGKTTTKEFVASALRPLGPVLKTEGNRNSEYSTPLLFAELTPDHRSIVVEMGMRGFGQVAHLASFTKPTMGLVTNIGFSHLEQVKTREGIARAKGELLEVLPQDGHAVLWQEDPYCDFLKSLSMAPVSTFGFSSEADCHVTQYQALSWRSCKLQGVCRGESFETLLPVVGRHLALNAVAAVLVASLAGVPPSQSSSALSVAELPPMRMEIVEWEGLTIVLDAYNAAPPSVIAALETLADVPAKGKKAAVLGQMRELGDYSEQGHRDVGRALAASGVEQALLIGEEAGAIASGAVEAGMRTEAIAHVKSLGEVAQFLKSLAPGDTVLIKGSRALGLERALDLMKEPVA